MDDGLCHVISLKTFWGFDFLSYWWVYRHVLYKAFVHIKIVMPENTYDSGYEVSQCGGWLWMGASGLGIVLKLTNSRIEEVEADMLMVHLTHLKMVLQ